MVPLHSMLSALLVALYLSAAFVPCKPAVVFVDWTREDGLHAAGMPGAPPSAGASVASTTRSTTRSTGARQADQSASHGSHHPAMHASHHAAAQPSSAPIADETAAVRRRPGTDAPGELRLEPTCLCGCSESRATVGGSASRLGAAVPGVHVVRLVEALPPAVLDLEHPRAPDRSPVHDPIPI